MPFMLYLLACAVCAMGTSEFMLAGLLPAIASDLGVTMGAAGVLTSGFAVGMAVGAPLMAGWTRRWAPRLTLLWCLLVFACCHVLAAITTDYSILLTTRVVSALANAGFLAVALGLATQLVPADRKGRALSILLSGTTIAMVAGVPAGALIGTALGWRATFWCVAGLCLLVTAGLARGWSEHAAVAASSTSTATSLGAELRQLRSPGLLGPMLLGALVNGATFAALTYLAPIVTEVSGLAEGFVAVVLMLFGAGSFVGVAIAGRLADQRPGLLLGVGGPLLLGGWIALALVAASPALLLTFAFVQGVLAFGVGSAVITRVLYGASEAPTMGGSYATAALNTGAAAGPVCGALGLAEVGALGGVWVAVAGTAGAGLVAVLSWPTLTSPSPGHAPRQLVEPDPRRRIRG